MSLNKHILFFWLIFFILLGVFLAFFAKPLFLSLLLVTQDWQRLFHDKIGDLLHVIHETQSWAATGSLALIGFLYGILHAVGPGHGKVVVSSYLLAGEHNLKRGLFITFTAAFLQAVMAIILVLGLSLLLGLSQNEAQGTALTLERLSLALIALVGGALLFRGVKQIKDLFSTQDAVSCDHAHDLTVEQPNRKTRKWGPILIALSIGLRPCSGALLLLLFASLLGAVKAGVLATFAMALGTAITTSTIAFLAVKSKSFAFKLSGSKGKSLPIVHAGFSFFGGVIILLFAIALFSISGTLFASVGGGAGMMDAAHHPLMRNFSQTISGTSAESD
ncbi:MAG TPA: hypothetical protein DD400_01895 [Rhodospirillaceae bacterium]|nr:hypothetical protein [Rhodospirillaceae bacterium]